MKNLFLIFLVLICFTTYAQNDTTIFIKYLRSGFNLESKYTNGTYFKSDKSTIYITVNILKKEAFVFELKNRNGSIVSRGFLSCDSFIVSSSTVFNQNSRQYKNDADKKFVFKRNGWWEFFINGSLFKRIYYLDDKEINIVMVE